ncbi:hypothetical protein E3U23_11250 [Erythrobacter litoralis]|uniref:hypothetical protein n=1 Tax=Erythrobacter litoralis TaxID=39960 RepID=UPI0024354B44|nr:hypothetical protein [Erythrobacter litoralis]MDG6079765.1 hypothetical protein [Erythrobacter litoralis]
MRLVDLVTVNDLVMRRGQLLVSIDGVKRGQLTITVGGSAMASEHVGEHRAAVALQLEDELTRNRRQLIELGVEFDDAEASACVPTVRVAPSHPLAAS